MSVATLKKPEADMDENSDSVADSSIAALQVELQAAATAAAAQFREIGATAASEAKLSIASAMAIATARLLSVAFMVMSWMSFMGLVIWYSIEAGVSPPLAFAGAMVLNLLIAMVLLHWKTWLTGNIGMPRTLDLLRAIPGRDRE